MIGETLRLISILTLGEHYNLRIERPKVIIQKGIYRYAKHPAYWGSLLVILGLCLIHPILGVMMLSWAFFYARMVEENRFLNDKGEQMATVVPPPFDITGLLSNVIAMKQREKEFKHTLPLEKRKVAVAERGAAIEEGELKLKREGFNVVQEFQKAQARLMRVTAKQAAKDLLSDAKNARDNAIASLTKAQADVLDRQILQYDKLINSGDPEKEDLGIDLLFERNKSQGIGDMLEALSIQLQMQGQEFSQKLGMMNFENDQLRTGLSIMEGVLGREAQIKKGKDREFKESFDTGVEAMTNVLLKQSAGGAAAEKRPVGKGRTAMTPQFPGTAVSFGAPQMSLDAAIAALKGGEISAEDLLAAWPSLEGVIDKSLLAPSTPTAPAAPAAPGANAFQGLTSPDLERKLNDAMRARGK